MPLERMAERDTKGQFMGPYEIRRAMVSLPVPSGCLSFDMSSLAASPLVIPTAPDGSSKTPPSFLTLENGPGAARH